MSKQVIGYKYINVKFATSDTILNHIFILKNH